MFASPDGVVSWLVASRIATMQFRVGSVNAVLVMGCNLVEGTLIIQGMTTNEWKLYDTCHMSIVEHQTSGAVVLYE